MKKLYPETGGVLDKQCMASASIQRGKFALGKSFRFQRPRGAFCLRGWCQQCKVELRDGSVGLACSLVSSELSSLRKQAKYRIVFGLLARILPPWFHESVIFPASWMQQLFLKVLRYATGALPMHAQPVIAGGLTHTQCDTVVVGRGAAGRAAARKLSEAGVDTILVGTGGNDKDSSCKFQSLPDTIALGIYPSTSVGDWQLLCASACGSLDITFRRLVLATGAYDRLPAIPGSDLPGIVGSDAFADLIGARSLPKNARIAIFAPDRIADELMELAERSGTSLAWVATDELPARPDQTIIIGAWPVRIRGRHKINSVEFSDGSTRPCDLLVVGYRQPAYELFIQAGMSARYLAPGEAIQFHGSPKMPLLGVGETVGQTGDDIERQTEERVADWLDGKSNALPVPPAKMPVPERLVDDVLVCPCEDVTARELRAAIADGFDTIEHLKRRTGAATGPCQGKLCHCMILQCLDEAQCHAELPTIRPLVRPVRLSNFVSKA